MAETDGVTLFDQAMAEIKANRPDQAKELLLKLLHAEPQHEQAWFWLAGVVPRLDQTIECLERVLALNPQNTQAKDWLALAQQEQGVLPKSPVPKAEEGRAVASLGTYLITRGYVTPRQLEAALKAQDKTSSAGKPRRLGDILIEQGALTRERLQHAVDEQRLDYFSLMWD